MCGIFGLAALPHSGFDAQTAARTLNHLFELSETRGREAAGLAVLAGGRISVHKDSVSAGKMIRSQPYRAFLSEALSAGDDSTAIAAIGHSRLVTNGLQGIDENNQPIVRDGTVIVHNGIVVNVDSLWNEHPDLIPQTGVDTEVIPALLKKEMSGGADLWSALRTTFSSVYGEASIAMLFDDQDVLLFATNTGSVYLMPNEVATAVVMASEAFILEKLVANSVLPDGFDPGRIQRVSAGHAVGFDLKNLHAEKFALQGPSRPEICLRPTETREIRDRAKRDELARKNLRRCTKTLLPETMPFIEFDDDGVSNYGKEYVPIEHKGRPALEDILSKFRSSDGTPDCLVAFSGGRDSSYGLHLLVREFGMHPVAYTYDWGMVTDLGRRNQARMCGELGVEHIWVSADIKAKRANIRRNIEAWMKRPDLGIVPLFMAGDKQFFQFASQTMKQTGIKLMVFCDNKLEKTNFKTGFCGVRPDHGQKRVASLRMGQTAQMMFYYINQFVRNPAYINRSIPDTMQAFMSYYVLPTNFVHMFDYVEWDEATVNNELTNTYDWETAPDTNSTWRIGDGTAAFYNYVYYTVAGFTEHDTFRSNQICEGMLGRDEALQLVEEENQPRYDSIREYCHLVGVDFDDLLRTVNNMPRLYHGR